LSIDSCWFWSWGSVSSPTGFFWGGGAGAPRAPPATVTEIEADHLFYLMARGIDEKTARGLLVKAFVAEVIEELENEPVVEALEAKLDDWFAIHG
jgi:hypothetical protein